MNFEALWKNLVFLNPLRLRDGTAFESIGIARMKIGAAWAEDSA